MRISFEQNCFAQRVSWAQEHVLSDVNHRNFFVRRRIIMPPTIRFPFLSDLKNKATDRQDKAPSNAPDKPNNERQHSAFLFFHYN